MFIFHALLNAVKTPDFSTEKGGLLRTAAILTYARVKDSSSRVLTNKEYFAAMGVEGYDHLYPRKWKGFSQEIQSITKWQNSVYDIWRIINPFKLIEFLACITSLAFNELSLVGLQGRTHCLNFWTPRILLRFLAVFVDMCYSIIRWWTSPMSRVLRPFMHAVHELWS